MCLLECRYKESLPLTDMWYINGRVESLPLTNMRYISGWVESIVLRRKAEDFSVMRTSEHTVKEIERKAKKVMGMLKRGVKFMPTQPNVIAILEKLKQSK